MIDDPIPAFPEEIGASVTFMKGGAEYRLLRHNADTWLIHKHSVPRETFELNLTPDGREWTVEGRGHVGPVFGGPASLEMIWRKLF